MSESVFPLPPLASPPSPPPPSLYYLVQVPDAEPSTVQTFPTREELVRALKEVHNRPGPATRVLVFAGQQHYISQGPLRFLLVAEERLPLFDIPQDTPPDPDGYLGGQILPPARLEETDREEPEPDDTFGGDGDDLEDLDNS